MGAVAIAKINIANSYVQDKAIALSKTYNSPQGYWQGITAIKKLANAAKVSKYIAQMWLKGKHYGKYLLQTISYIYFNSSSIIERSICTAVVDPNTSFTLSSLL